MRKRHSFRTDYPVTFWSVIILLLFIPLSIILYFVVGTDASYNYLFPIACALVIATFVELIATKHGEN